jgi:carbon monoxide dehydrogenase subunit G
MIVSGTFSFAGPPETVWQLLRDPEVLVKTLPGAKQLARTTADRYEGVMQIGVGPVTAAEFLVAVTLADQVPHERYAMLLDGKGALGFARGTAHVALAPEGAGGTIMKYRAELQVGGKIAAVGQRLLDSAAKLVARQGLEALNRELRARLGQASP